VFFFICEVPFSGTTEILFKVLQKKLIWFLFWQLSAAERNEHSPPTANAGEDNLSDTPDSSTDQKNEPRSYRLEAGADEAEYSHFLQEKIVARLSELHQIGKTAGAVYLKAQQNLLKRLERIKNANQYVESLLKNESGRGWVKT